MMSPGDEEEEQLEDPDLVRRTGVEVPAQYDEVSVGLLRPAHHLGYLSFMVSF